MFTTSLRRITAATLSLGMIAALTAAPAAASPGDLFPLAHPAVTQATPDAGFETARRGRGADDAPGHVRGGGKGSGRGADDGPNHS